MFRTAQQHHAAPIERASTMGQPASTQLASMGGGVARHPTKPGATLRRYPHRLNFYSVPPVNEITIDEFEAWAIDRLRVLAEVETCQARNHGLAETRQAVMAQAKQYLPLGANSAARSGIDVEAERHKDHVSHFVLRLAFCRSEDLRRRFVKAETMLFRLRMETDDTQENRDFLATLRMDQTMVTEGEKAAHRSQLIAVAPWLKSSFETEGYFKVPWTRVPDLVEKRRVYLEAGTAWVPMREQSSLILAEFSKRLMADLEMTARALPRLDEDDRLIPVLSHLSMGFLAGATDFTDSAIVGEDGGHITAAMVESLVRRHAPMCMRNLQETLSSKHHLKHYGRLQYNLFLKDLGLPIDEALAFWRRSFSLMTDDVFNKEYRYNIRHGYGLEGRKVNYPAKSCARILTQDQPGPQDNHGCPFRHFSPQNLASALAGQYGIVGTQEQNEVLSAVKAGHFHVACTRVFELSHRRYGVKRGQGLGEGESVQHPNRYFERSWKLARDGAAEAASKGEGDVKEEGEDETHGGARGRTVKREVKVEAEAKLVPMRATKREEDIWDEGTMTRSSADEAAVLCCGDDDDDDDGEMERLMREAEGEELVGAADERRRGDEDADAAEATDGATETGRATGARGEADSNMDVDGA